MQSISFVLPTVDIYSQKEMLTQQTTAAIVCGYLDYRARQGDSTTSTTLQIADLVDLINQVQQALSY